MKATSKALKAGRMVVLACAALASFAPVRAGTALWCEGTINQHWINSGGDLYVNPSWRADHVALCNVNTTNAAGITPTVCMSWAAIIRAAMQRNAQTTIFYGDAPVTSCGLIPSYTSAPSPTYVMIR